MLCGVRVKVIHLRLLAAISKCPPDTCIRFPWLNRTARCSRQPLFTGQVEVWQKERHIGLTAFHDQLFYPANNNILSPLMSGEPGCRLALRVLDANFCCVQQDFSRSNVDDANPQRGCCVGSGAEQNAGRNDCPIPPLDQRFHGHFSQDPFEFLSGRDVPRRRLKGLGDVASAQDEVVTQQPRHFAFEILISKPVEESPQVRGAMPHRRAADAAHYRDNLD